MRHALLALLLTTATAAASTPSQALEANPPVGLAATRPVDLVIVLDTSGSMEDLLDSVRARVWDIVNELGRMTPQPELRVGLVSFGSPGPATEEEGFVALRSDLTSDLDHLYGELMALRTDGGEEYVGWALQTAVERMSWSPDPEGLRLLFIAGNESADQAVDQVDFRVVAESARRADILINALYAGSREAAPGEKWPEVARAGGGNFSAIDPSLSLAQIATPLDQTLLDLNARLNETYLPYGEAGEAGLTNQRVQDNNATRLGVQSCSSRVVAKGSALYDNSAWDLVDAALKEEFQWAALRDSDLPEELRPLSPADRVARVKELRSEREGIQEAIGKASEARELFLRELRREAVEGQGLDEALRESLIAQARAKGFSCGGC